MPLFLYPVENKVLKEISDDVAKRLSDFVTESQEYLMEHMPLLDPKSGREKLAFFRTTDPLYWENLVRTNPAWAKSKIMEWASLVRREARGWR